MVIYHGMSLDRTIVQKRLEKNERPSYCEIRKYDFVVKCAWSKWNDLRLKNGILYRESNTFCMLLYHFVKDDEYFSSHDEKTSAHLGVRKTLAKIKWKYYLPGIRRDVKVYVADRETCSKRERPLKRKRAPTKTHIYLVIQWKG